jgi:hypothetical protein
MTKPVPAADEHVLAPVTSDAKPRPLRAAAIKWVTTGRQPDREETR